MNILIVYGGYNGHHPREIAILFKNFLQSKHFDVIMSESLEIFDELEFLCSQDLIIPIWTMGEITENQINNISKAVKSGVGLAGCHDGMCDAFRNCPEWQFITGSNWVAHPGGDKVPYEVKITSLDHPITEELEDFKVVSEQYYLHVDPSVNILASTIFEFNGASMPVAYTKEWGSGRVFYNSIGHDPSIFKNEAWLLMQNGLLWAAKAI